MPHFHTTHDVVYVSYRDKSDGQLRLRAYLCVGGGELEEYRYPPLPEAEDARADD